MNWIVPLILGLIIGWFLELLIDWFYWRLRDVEGSATVDCSKITADYEEKLQNINLSLDRYRADLNAKSSEVTDLTASLDAKDRQLADLNVALGERDVEISGLNATLGSKDLELGELNVAMRDKEFEVEGLRGRLLGGIRSPGWFDWGEYDFFNWNSGDDVEFVGTGDAGDRVDVTYGGDIVGSADVDAGGNWKLPWAVPAAFLPGMLGFIRRDRNGVEVDASHGEMSAAIDAKVPSANLNVDASLPEVDVDVEASVPDVDVDVDANARGGWFNWGDWDFGGWREGDEHELSGVGEPGGSVDINYDGEYQGTAEVDADGKWSFPFKVPGMFAAGGLGLLARNRGGAEVEASSGLDAGLELPSVEADASADVDLNLGGIAAAGATAGALGGAFIDLVNDRQQTTIRLEDIEGDDLTKIWGIGPKTKLNFYRHGITTFDQFANIDPDLLSQIMTESKLMSARIPQDPHKDWTGLAALAAKGDWDGFKAMTTKIKPPEPERKKKRKKAVKLDGDKLSDISGIGRGTWKALHGMGYNSYAKLAGISVEEVEQAMKKSRALNAPGAPTPAEAHASWTELAGYAANGDWASFNAVNAGVETVITETVSVPTRFDSMGYDFSDWEAGQSRSIFGREAAGAVINFFYDGQKVGETVAKEDGSWEFPFQVPAGFTPSLITFTMN